MDLISKWCYPTIKHDSFFSFFFLRTLFNGYLVRLIKCFFVSENNEITVVFFSPFPRTISFSIGQSIEVWRDVFFSFIFAMQHWFGDLLSMYFGTIYYRHGATIEWKESTRKKCHSHLSQIEWNRWHNKNLGKNDKHAKPKLPFVFPLALCALRHSFFPNINPYLDMLFLIRH